VSILFFFGLSLPKYVSVANPLSIANVRRVEASILPSGLMSFLDCISIRKERKTRKKERLLYLAVNGTELHKNKN
jgi:hypothetical protein